uniref:Uncharacterized protein n=1 Tax=viral metagenome TaxID=1070528 RepID=A0A6C0IWJ1_9ZZZZ
MNCYNSNNLQSESKTKRLSKSVYNRPETTLTDTLQTNTEMTKKLANYMRVDDIEDVNINTHVRYVTLKEGKQRFCLGGLLKKIHSKYVILSNGTFSWSVQRYHWDDEHKDPIFVTAFFRILSKSEQQEKIILEQQKELETLRKLTMK